MTVSANRTQVLRLLTSDRLRMNGRSARAAEFGFVADPRETVRANSIQIALMQSEIGAAEFALQRPVRSRCAAMRAADDGGVMRLRLVDREHLAAVATKSLADGQGRSVILAFTVRTGNEKTHRNAEWGMGNANRRTATQLGVECGQSMMAFRLLD
jgi:hypothetical protein